VETEKRWTINQIHEVSWNVGWGEHDMEETEIIPEQTLSPQDEEQEGDPPVNEAGWETVDEDELPEPPAQSGSEDLRRSVDDPQIPDVPSLTFSTSTTTSSLPNLSPTRTESRVGAAGQRNFSRDSKRWDDVIHEEGDENRPLTPTDEEELLKPQLAAKGDNDVVAKNNGGSGRVHLNSLDLDVANSPAKV